MQAVEYGTPTIALSPNVTSAAVAVECYEEIQTPSTSCSATQSIFSDKGA